MPVMRFPATKIFPKSTFRTYLHSEFHLKKSIIISILPQLIELYLKIYFQK
jgi:hypothetical protein